ncbi:MAG: disulfide bond formation protein B [bacterium]|nr:disulfide bond formation protein B [bacterium]
MNSLVPLVDTMLGALTILAQVASLGLILAIISKGKILGAYKDTIEKNILWVGFVVSLIATSGSLFFSEVAGYTPCILCWYQRILMYPQTILFLVAIIRKDRGIIPYALALSIIGGVIAIYHYYGQVAATGILPCSALGYAASCSTRFTLQYGYITIPMMAFSAFLLIALASLASRGKKDYSSPKS